MICIRKILLSCFLFVAAMSAYAQQTSNTRAQQWRYKGTIQAGILNGEANAAFQAQTVHGVQYHTWFAGLGFGLDNYRYRTIPLFFQLNKNILNKPSTPYVFGDIGMQFPWVKDEQAKWLWGGEKFDYKTGLYANLGTGYRFNIAKKYSLLFNAAWSLKKVKEIYDPACDDCVPQQKVQNDYTLQRLSLMMGFGF